MDQLTHKTVDELRNIAKYYGISPVGLKKPTLIKRIMSKLIAEAIPKFSAYQSIKKMGYEIEWTLDPDEMSELCCICKPDLLAHSYEELVYGSIDAEEGIIGLYIKKDNIVILTAVIDLGCATVCKKLALSEKQMTDYVEVKLLCSNPVHRIPGIASLVLDFTKQIASLIGKKHLLLIVSNWSKNQGAVAFYKRNGFVPTQIKEIMVYDL